MRSDDAAADAAAWDERSGLHRMPPRIRAPLVGRGSGVSVLGRAGVGRVRARTDAGGGRGGQARGFDRMMPSFSEALTPEQVDALVAHLRTFCRDDSWPRGELNLPRAMFTEKAYPEDEAVLTTGVALEGAGAITNELIFEKRI